MTLSNYQLLEVIAEESHVVVYRAFRKNDPGRIRTIKILKANQLTEYRRLLLKHKIEHLKILDDPLLITPQSIEEENGDYFIVQDYFAGIPLDQWIGKRPGVSLEEFFTIASGLARALEKVHAAGIIHGGIKPHNVLVDPRTLAIRLIDFISVVDVREVSHFIYDPYFIRGTLAYTSPEQAGRINHRVVFSSDLYSLGIIFYEMLTGRLPFFSNDPLELIHAHLAGEVPPIHELKPGVPAILSKIVATLMLKEPEKRYQSSGDLLADLKRCQDEYACTGVLRGFPLQINASTRQDAFISKMVGREGEAGSILEEYEKVAGGAFRSLFISGLPGIGKTRLIQELQKPIVKHRGYFTSGKFDIYQKNIPYSSLIQALTRLTRVFLTESNERIQLWKTRILGAVGQNGRILTDVIPELEILLGSQPEVPPLPPVEARNRFDDVFDRFLTSLASPENPLTLFIDDLQWCDAASFDFLANVFANYQDHPYLFFIGAYRHNEVDSSHPLAKLLQNAREVAGPVREIQLESLKPQDCQEMVAYILDADFAQTQSLADFLCSLTEGNPLFVSESLAYLHNEDLLFPGDGGQWQWDIEKISRSQMPNTVVALFSAKIHKLPPKSIALLEYSACMGNSFLPAELALVTDMPLVETYKTLQPALEQGLLIENKARLQFIHDRVQEAALSTLPDHKRRRIHWQIGQHLLADVPVSIEESENLDNLFTIVSHLNLGRADHLDSKTAYFLSDLNYHAGNKALNALATESANEYFTLGRDLLPANCWEGRRYERTFRIYQKSAKTELMCGNVDQSERLISQLLAHARTDLDRTETLAEQAASFSSIGDFVRAIETANLGLAYFEKAIPEGLEAIERKRAALIAEIESKQLDIRETFLSMLFSTDRRSKVEHAFYSELLADLYLSGLTPQLYLIAAQATLHCLSAGMDESVIYAFVAMGIYYAEQGDFEQSFVYEDLTRDLAEKYPNTFAATKCMTGIVFTLMHARSHPKEIVDYSLKAIQCGKSCGDLNNAGYAYGPLMWLLRLEGADLVPVEDYAQECLKFSHRYHLGIAEGLAEAMQAGWIEPMKNAGPSTPIQETLEKWERNSHAISLGSYYFHKALAHYYFGEYSEASHYHEQARKYILGISNNPLKWEWYIFLALIAIRRYEQGTAYGSQQDLMDDIQPVIRRIEGWIRFGPTFQPYLAFLYAEIERVSGDFREARSLYLDAIQSAREQGYTFLEGHLNECLGEYLGQTEAGAERMYLIEAARLYQYCRAERKKNRLVDAYPGYFAEPERRRLPPQAEPVTPPVFPNLDVNYLMKSSLAISAEMDTNLLLRKIMDVVIECSGAQHGYLLVDQEGSLLMRSESHVSEKGTAQTVARRLEDTEAICKAIIRYVHRSGERVVLDDACQDGAFKDNPEVQEMQLRSILCLPVTKQSRRIGVLYLENRVSNAVFTPEKVQMTELLTSQAAVSLENARLVEEMKQAQEEAMLNRARLEVQRRLIEQREQERLQIARDLHDGPLQDLFATALVVQGLIMDSDDPDIQHGLESVRDTLQEKVNELRAYAAELRPPAISKFGLIKTIQSHSEALAQKNPELQIHFTAAPEEDHLPENIRLTLFRIYQQALNNTIKHSGATDVWVNLRADSTKTELEIYDNGAGFDLPSDWLDLARQGHLGLVGMRERAEAVGGQVEIHSQPGAGTRLRVAIPLS